MAAGARLPNSVVRLNTLYGPSLSAQPRDNMPIQVRNLVESRTELGLSPWYSDVYARHPDAGRRPYGLVAHATE